MQLIKVTYTNGEKYTYDNFTDALFAVMLMTSVLELKEISYRHRGMNTLTSVKPLARLAKTELLMKLERVERILVETDVE